MVRLDTDLGLLRVMPPLFDVQALFTPWRESMADLRPMRLLAVGLVLSTATRGAGFVHWLVRRSLGVDLRARGDGVVAGRRGGRRGRAAAAPARNTS